jgi:hypothetical protein
MEGDTLDLVENVRGLDAFYWDISFFIRKESKVRSKIRANKPDLGDVEVGSWGGDVDLARSGPVFVEAENWEARNGAMDRLGWLGFASGSGVYIGWRG